MSTAGQARRTRALEQLAETEFDLLVIGGGIIGSRVAYEAARTGLRTALVDAGDFGGATSSASSKMIHGGLRYLAMYDFGLVHEAHLERRALLHHVAPHLVNRLPFLLPLYRHGPFGVPKIAAGLLLYSAMSGFRESTARVVPAARASAMVSPLKTEGLRGCGMYLDAQVNDGRLCIATVTAAARAGAVVANYVRVQALRNSAGMIVGAALQSADDGSTIELRCRSVINASGPWTDHIRRLEQADAAPTIRLSKGIHVTLPVEGTWQAALTVPLDQTRVTFALPWEGMLLLGTTDTAFEGEPESVGAGEDDIASVLREAAIALPDSMLRRENVRFSFAGLRALPLGKGDTASSPREHVITVGPGGMVSVAGGKLTTHRRIALQVLNRLPSNVLPRQVKLDDTPLPGSSSLPARTGSLDPALYSHLAHLYGSEMDRVLAYGRSNPEALLPIHRDGPDIWAQADYARDEEYALTPDDILRRRTTVSVRGLATADLLKQFSARAVV
ncbi:MAG TPA: glycerol-3-phosphate dehydrogenase/oxidase [Candidatus Dormibacteraeota bacterium]|jgi:glycerol-3-phosphate dehydrogenase